MLDHNELQHSRQRDVCQDEFYNLYDKIPTKLTDCNSRCRMSTLDMRRVAMRILALLD